MAQQGGDRQASGTTGSAQGARPAGEIGGHTVQAWEQDPAAGMVGNPTSKDVPPPQAGAAEARSPSPP